jgi:peptidoglycan L-alanyl-D-glutamate endopeptidase CwlK
MDTVSENRLALVHPALAAKIRVLANDLCAEKIYIRVTQGLRSVAEQDALYAQGRTAPGKVVTNCRGGHSYHNFGLAVDVVPAVGGALVPAFVPDWNVEHPAWKKIVEIGTGLGLASGALWRTFKDYPHLQLNGRFPEGAPDDEVRQLFADGGMKAVWDEAGISNLA